MASKTGTNYSQDRVTLHSKNGPILTRKLLQRDYNPRGQYLPILKNLQLHKFLLTKRIGHDSKIVFVFNGQRQLASDIS